MKIDYVLGASVVTSQVRKLQELVTAAFLGNVLGLLDAMAVAILERSPGDKAKAMLVSQGLSAVEMAEALGRAVRMQSDDESKGQHEANAAAITAAFAAGLATSSPHKATRVETPGLKL